MGAGVVGLWSFRAVSLCHVPAPGGRDDASLLSGAKSSTPAARFGASIALDVWGTLAHIC